MGHDSVNRWQPNQKIGKINNSTTLKLRTSVVKISLQKWRVEPQRGKGLYSTGNWQKILKHVYILKKKKMQRRKMGKEGKALHREEVRMPSKPMKRCQAL